MDRFTGIIPTQESRDWCQIAFILLWSTWIARAADCHYDISTEVYPSVINYTGMGCTWNITAPSPHGVYLTFEVFELVSGNSGSTGDEAVYQVSDEVGRVGPFPLGHTSSVFYSDFSLLVLTANTSPNLPNVIFQLTATIGKVVEAYFCDFEVASDCTAAVAGNSEWIYGHIQQGLDNVCQSLQGSTLSNTGLFYNSPVQNVTSRLLSQPLEMGRYFVLVDVLWACADPMSSSTMLRVTFEAEQYTGSSTVVALDNIRISKILDPVASPTAVAMTTTSTTEESDAVASPTAVAMTMTSKTEEGDDVTESTVPVVMTTRPTTGSAHGNNHRLLLAGGGALASSSFLILIVHLAACCLRKRRFKSHQSRSGTATTGPIGIDNLTHETRSRRYPSPLHEENDFSYNDVSLPEIDNPQYQNVNAKTPAPAPVLELRSADTLYDNLKCVDDDHVVITTPAFMSYKHPPTETTF